MAYLNKLIALFIKYQKKLYLKLLRGRDNVNIDGGFVLGNYSEINIVGVCKQLLINKGVSTRNFCNLFLYPNATLIIGENVFFNNSCSVNCLGHIEIGSNVIFGENVKIYDHNHLYGVEDSELIVKREEYKIGRVIIGRNSWIGSNVTILNNVEIGENVIVGANCLIYKSVPANSVVKHVENLIITQ